MTDSKTDAEWQAICDSYAEENQRLSDQLAAVRRSDAESVTLRRALGDIYEQCDSAPCGEADPWIVALSFPAAQSSDAEIGEHLRQIKAFASSINERNFFDIALHIERQADAALSLPAADRGGE